MPINRLTAFSVLAVALLVVAPVQANTSKTHGKPTSTKSAHAKPVHAKSVHAKSPNEKRPNEKHAQLKQAHAKSAHRKPTHAEGKFVKATHKAVHSRSAASSIRMTDAVIPAATDTVAAVETGPELPSSGLLQAQSSAVADSPVAANLTPSWLNQAPVFSPARMLVQSAAPSYFGALVASDAADDERTHVAVVDTIDHASADQRAPATADRANITDLRKALVAMAMGLRDIRYVRGGHDPSTGFDCSGFVRYVFAHAIGMQLPTNSAGQFLDGLTVKRADMKPGDLVFFHTHGKRRISHVGIYISDGRFIHSPTSGKSVQISSLDDAYWAKHFAGARRPEAMAMLARNG